jgi:type IV secretory pathway TrbF-like protein
MDKPLHYNLSSTMGVTNMISIPITLEQLITAVRQLPSDERAQIANALVQAGLHSDLTALIQELYTQSPIDDVTDDDIMAEIKAVRQASQAS